MIAAKESGLLLLNKKPGFTSFDSLAAVKRAFNTGKAGHTGTLDKFAGGLLLVLVGRGVKLVPLFSGCVKEYTGTVRFGEETDTLDPEGAVCATGPIPSREQVEAVLPAFRGDILQAPPEYSALHINGRRAHELVREGIKPEIKKRPVTIHSLEILSWTPPQAVIRAAVSSGTYIRSLARDIAIAAGSRAHLTALVRTRVGAFRLEDSVEDNGAEENKSGETLQRALRPLDSGLFETLSLPYFLLDTGAARGFFHGKPLPELLAGAEFLPPANGKGEPGGESSETGSAAFSGVFLKDAAGKPERLIGILERKNGNWGYAHVFTDN